MSKDLEVSGEEQYVITLAEMLLAIKKQLDRVEKVVNNLEFKLVVK